MVEQQYLFLPNPGIYINEFNLALHTLHLNLSKTLGRYHTVWMYDRTVLIVGIDMKS